jgi:hypothetical protein
LRYLDLVFLIIILNAVMAAMGALGTNTFIYIPDGDPTVIGGQHKPTLEDVEFIGSINDSTYGYQEVNSINGTKTFWSKIKDTVRSEELTDNNGIIRNFVPTGVADNSNVLWGAGDMVRALLMFTTIFVTGLTTIPRTLANLGVPAFMIYLFSIGIYFLYLMAVLQTVSGKNLGGSE